jgi:phospholipase C
MRIHQSFGATFASVALVLAPPTVLGCGDDTVAPPSEDGGGDVKTGDAGGREAMADATADRGPDGQPSSDATPDQSVVDAAPDQVVTDGGLAKLNHIVVIYLENWSFDSLYGEFAGAEGLTSDGGFAAPKQIDPNGAVYATLPQVEATLLEAGAGALPNAPFALDPYFTTSNISSVDPVHRFYQEQMQIHGGTMDSFVSVSNARGLIMGYFQTSDLPLANAAKDYAVCDHFFHAAFGGSFLNHIWLIAAQTPVFPNPPTGAGVVAQPNDAGLLDRNDAGLAVNDGFITPDNFVINTSYSVNTPHPPTANPAQLVPNQTFPTIGDRLSDKSIDWAWYSGGWNAALAQATAIADAGLEAGVASEAGVETRAKIFQYHHQPFIYFDNYKDGTAARAAHLKDEDDFIAAVNAGMLPPVSFVKPAGIDNEHPNYTNVIDGENHVLDLITKIKNNATLWTDTAIIVTYDENGGFWDHVPPPVVDRWGPGTRVPALVISPYAKKHFVDKTVYDTTSILALIEHRFGLMPLTSRDMNAADLTNAFDFSQTP